jgi:GNAT superfamily N-acetyltransferase
VVIGDVGCFTGAMTDVRTSRLQLHAVDVAEGERIVAGSPGPDDAWADDFPFEVPVDTVRGFLAASYRYAGRTDEAIAMEEKIVADRERLRATAARWEQRPFGPYRITSLADGRAVGVIGFNGQPDGGCVEIGYGLAPSARGHGYAAEAVVALLAIAADHGLSRVIAETTLDNVASQRTLIRAGFRLACMDGELHHYEALLDIGDPPV